MRKVFILALMASAALPAAAVAGPDNQSRPRQHSSSDSTSDSGERQRPSRSSSDDGDRQSPRPARSFSGGGEGGKGSGWSRGDSGVTASSGQQTQETQGRRDSDGSQKRQGWRNSGNPTTQNSDESFAERARQWRERHPEGSTTTTTRPGNSSGSVTTQHRDRDRNWSSTWRNDRRYDWQRYRDRNRSTFRLGIYLDPYGYRYRRYSIGWNMWPSYYQSSYWLDDPWMYRLPPVYGPYRWVRYWDDALLVNIYTGEVVDVIYSFFW